MDNHLNRIISRQMDSNAGMQTRHRPVEGSLLQAEAVNLLVPEHHVHGRVRVLAR